MAAVAIPESPGSALGGDEERVEGNAGQDIDASRLLGVSTPDQVFQQWEEFLQSSSETLRDRTLCQGESHDLAVTCPASFKIGGATSSSSGGGVPPRASPAETLKLLETPPGYAATLLSEALRETRTCVSTGRGLLRQLSLFGERCEMEDQGAANKVPANYAEFGAFLPQLEAVRDVLDRCAALTQHLLQQLVALHSLGSTTSYGAQFKGFEQLPPPWPVVEALGELLMLPTTVDGMFLENRAIRDAFCSYEWAVKNPKADDQQISAEAAATLASSLRSFAPMVESRCFTVLLDRLKTELRTLRPEASVSAVRERLMKTLKSELENPEALTKNFSLPASLLIPRICIIVMLTRVWPQPKYDNRTAADIWKVYRNTKPAVVLGGRIVWCLGDFLQAFFPNESSLQEDMHSLRVKQAQRLDEGTFVHEIEKLHRAVQEWLAGIGSTVRALSSGNVSSSLKHADHMVQRGMVLAIKVRGLLEEYLMLHLRTGVPFKQSCLSSITLGFQLLKVIEAGPSTQRWAELSVFLHRRLAFKVHRDVQDTLARLERHQKRSGAIASLGAGLKAVLAALHCILSGAAPADELDEYFDIGALVLCFAGALIAQDNKRHTAVRDQWSELRSSFRWQHQLQNLCDTSWCFWLRRDVFKVLLNDLQSSKSAPRGVLAVPGLCQAFAAPLETLLVVPAAGNDAPNAPVREMRRDVVGTLAIQYLYSLRKDLQEAIIEPLAQSIEDSLRNHVFGVTQSLPDNLTLNIDPRVRSFLWLRPLRLGPKVVVDIKDQVEMRLSKVFYDLTALQPQDAEVYLRMRSLAERRYGLRILEGSLPAGSQDNGLDVINLMKEIDKLAAQYSYSIHQQFFTQSSNQQADKIHIVTLDHVAASVQIHGVGIVNTAAAYSIPFLNQKVQIVAKFINGVKSRLVADERWFEQRKLDGEKGYTWARASETAKEVRAMGSGKDGVSVLDKLRQVVTHIGNSLGYVRMVRNAGLRVIGKSLPVASLLLPPSQKVSPTTSLLEAARSAESGEQLMKAVEVADDLALGVQQRFQTPADHLLILATFFGKPDRKEAALAYGANLFHFLIPALTVSFMDSILLGREALEKRASGSAGVSRKNAYCFDDGFAVGLAFLLRIFGLEKDFQALHWFDSKVDDIGQGGRINTVQGAVNGDGTTSGGAKGGNANANANAWASRRQAELQAELALLDRTLEAASTLFGPPPSLKAKAAPTEGEGGADEEERGEPAGPSEEETPSAD
mmetsp:Transcript_92222/g.192845  ORF Transcript_92222/g.192845 Transcript_92222/m.192845 type:complete len:1244 (-) Transcript_92222:152-3883(-)